MQLLKRLKQWWLVQPKLDGLSVELCYHCGLFDCGITRGDGITGDDISQNIVNMKNFVPEIPDFDGSIFAEILVTHKDFAKLNKLVDEPYSNPRNAASGIAQRLDGLYSEYCSLYAWDVHFTGEKI